jgi:hypothetical protein
LSPSRVKRQAFLGARTARAEKILFMLISNPVHRLFGAQKQRQKALLQAGDCSDWKAEISDGGRLKRI